MTQTEYIKKRIIERKDALYYKDFPTDAEKRECDLLMWLIDVLNEAQRLKAGHWIKKDDDGETYFECSECGDSWTMKVGTPLELVWNYCPNCGCRMESVDEQ